MATFYFADFEQVKKVVVIILTLNKSKKVCNELLRKYDHSLQGTVVERIKPVSFNMLTYSEEISNSVRSISVL